MCVPRYIRATLVKYCLYVNEENALCNNQRSHCNMSCQHAMYGHDVSKTSKHNPPLNRARFIPIQFSER